MVKMKVIKLLAFLFTISIVISSCYKDTFDFNPYEEIDEPEVTPTGDIQAFFDNIPDEFISETIDITDGEFILTEGGNLLELNPDIFYTEEDALVDGVIEFRYIELLDHPEYLKYNLPTVSNRQLLRTEGVFYFEAFKDGEPLKVKSGNAVKVRMPVEKIEEGMQLFYGEGEGDEFNWVPASESNAGTDAPFRISEWSVTLDSLQNFFSGFGYEFEADLFKWINVDIFNDIPEDQKTQVCVELEEQFSNQNTAVFMIFKDIRSIVGLQGDPDKELFCEPYGLSPIGYEVIFVAIASLGEDDFYFGIEEAKITENMIQYIPMESKSIDEIIEKINNL